MEYSLKANVKRLSGPPHPDREQQFQYIQAQRAAFLGAGLPVISIDTKKKELIGNFEWANQEYQTQRDRDMGQDRDFRLLRYARK